MASAYSKQQYFSRWSGDCGVPTIGRGLYPLHLATYLFLVCDRFQDPFQNCLCLTSLTPFLGGFHTHFFQGTFVWQYNLASSSTPTTSAFFSVFRVILNSSNSDSGLLEQQSTCRRPDTRFMKLVIVALLCFAKYTSQRLLATLHSIMNAKLQPGKVSDHDDLNYTPNLEQYV